MRSQVSARVCVRADDSRDTVEGRVGAVGCSIVLDARSRRMSREVGALVVAAVGVAAAGSRRIAVEIVLYLGA